MALTVPSLPVLAAALLLAAMVPQMAHAQGGVFIQRLPILDGGDPYILQFTNQQNFDAGVVVRSVSPLANVTTPQAFYTINKCGVLAPHFHPRGTEQLLFTQGQAEVGMFLEDNTLRKINVKAGQAVILPAGSVHYTRNTGNGKVQFIQTFDNPLAGTVFIAAAIAAIDPTITNSNLPGANFSSSVKASSGIFKITGTPGCS